MKHRSCGASGGGDGRRGGGFSLRVVGDFFAALVSQIAASLGLLTPVPAYALSETQKRGLNALAMRAHEAYDGNKVEHTDALKKLWSLAFGSKAPPKDLKSESWKEMGWQGCSPTTDFRAGGFLSLSNLIWLGENKPETFDKLRHKKNGERSEFEYPFAVAGVNLTFSLVEMCELKEEAPTTSTGICFAELIEAHGDEAFERLYALMFETLDDEWLRFGGATYMEFPLVLKATKQKIVRAMDGAKSFEDVVARLGT